MYLEP